MSPFQNTSGSRLNSLGTWCVWPPLLDWMQMSTAFASPASETASRTAPTLSSVSSASIESTQSPVALASAWFRAFANESHQTKSAYTLSVCRFATSTVVSVLPVSHTMISSNPFRLSRHASSMASSFLTMSTALSLGMACF